ncbi:hypothetical protein Hanom_Chr08g00706601 [Helianthus anomalus]
MIFNASTLLFTFQNKYRKPSCRLHNGRNVKHNEYQTMNTMDSKLKTQSMTTDKRYNGHQIKTQWTSRKAQ